MNINTGTLATSTLALTVTGATNVYTTLSINGATGAKALGAVTINNGGAINNTAGATITATGLTIISGGIWSSTTTAGAVTISGDVSNSGNFTNSVATTYSIAGNFTNNGSITSSTGLYTFTGNGKSFLGGTAFTITNLTISATGNYINSNTGGTTVGTLTITASSGVLTLSNNIAINTACNVNGTLNCGTFFVTGGGTFTLASAGTAFLSIGDPNGLTSTASTGNIQVTGARSYGALANYTYNGSAAQVTGNQLPTAGMVR